MVRERDRPRLWRAAFAVIGWSALALQYVLMIGPADGWAVLEWECCVKSAAQGAAEGAPFIEAHLIQPTETAFDDFAGGKVPDRAALRAMLGLG